MVTYDWVGWEADEDVEGKFYLTIRADGEELAIIVHRTCDGKFPLDGDVAEGKEQDAGAIVSALDLLQRMAL